MLLGGKGANLCEMQRLGLPVPFGFVISTKCCTEFFKNGDKGLPAALKDEYAAALKVVEERMGKKFGDLDNPLLVSVRSGAPASMPGMMDTVLNLGLNDEIVARMVETSGNARWAYDTQRRFIQMFSDVVMGIDGDKFEAALVGLRKERSAAEDINLTAEDLQELIKRYKKINPNVPDSPHEQLEMAIAAVFSSWFNQRAIRYRAYNNIPGDWGTAVNIQAMVFGNVNDDSGTGVAFSRNPATGENKFFGEWLPKAEGEDVVSGVRTPFALEQLKEKWPEIYQQLWDIQHQLEQHYSDMQDLEFTIENGKLFMLQCRNGKRTPKAAVKMAVDMVQEGMITEREAILRIPAPQMDFFLHPSIDPAAEKTVLGKGLPASPGAATGAIVFTPEEAETRAEQGEKVILCRRETTPEDIHGMKAAQGILTQLGGMTSHAAVVARGMGTACISGCSELHIDFEACTLLLNGHTLKKGDVITLDGTKGEVLLGEVKRIAALDDPDFQTVLGWADKFKKLGVLTNADTPHDAATAKSWGATGIGLCRTEHMFFDPARIDAMRAMIMSEDLAERQMHLDKLFEFQRADMKAMFIEMSGMPVTIRMLDPPLHEFLPQGEGACEHMSELLGKSMEFVHERVQELAEVNPMLGLRGCRLTVVHPEITVMQAKAIITAAIQACKEGADPKPEIMIPVVSSSKELGYIIPVVREAVEEVMKQHGVTLSYKLGTMVELPRACMRADTLADSGVTFFSFGTNDLTQTAWGISRDDMPAFVPAYVDKGVLEGDPFVSIDQDGVGGLIEIALQKTKGRGLTYGICGEHGGDPRSVEFFHRLGFDYVSCSPCKLS
ncbi:unnamed protein product [Chrysoparadoxa australica]